jgi:hypothetical protein
MVESQSRLTTARHRLLRSWVLAPMLMHTASARAGGGIQLAEGSVDEEAWTIAGFEETADTQDTSRTLGSPCITTSNPCIRLEKIAVRRPSA